jgi:hypothetical protein
MAGVGKPETTASSRPSRIQLSNSDELFIPPANAAADNFCRHCER